METSNFYYLHYIFYRNRLIYFRNFGAYTIVFNFKLAKLQQFQFKKKVFFHNFYG